MKKILAILLSAFMALTCAAAAEQEMASLANPWTDATPGEIRDALGATFGVPEGARDVIYRMLPETRMAEMDFTWDDMEYTARMQPSEAFEDISGLYYEWGHVDETGAVCGIPAWEARATDDEGTVDLCLWYDAKPGLMYAVSARSADDMDGFDIFAAAEAVYAGAEQSVLFSYRFADAAEGAELLLSNREYYESLNQSDLDYRMQKKGATLEELEAFAAEQIRDFTDTEKAGLAQAVADIEALCRERGYSLPYTDDIVFIKTTAREEEDSGGYTHGTQIYLNEQYVALGSQPDDPEIHTAYMQLIAHELFHCLTRNHPEFRRDMYAILGFTVVEDDYAFSKNIWDVIISNPDVEHHNSYAAFEINGESRDCTVVFTTTKPFDQPGDNFFDSRMTGLVPIDDMNTLYTSDEAANFWDVFGENTAYVIDPEETLADNFSFAVLFGTDGLDYGTPELIAAIDAFLRGEVLDIALQIRNKR